MDPTVWGKYQWTAIHFTALGYPKNPTENQKKVFFTYFNKILPEILPCFKCREHLKKTLKEEHPITDKDLVDADTLFAWTVALHNVVNKRLNKPEITLAEAKNIYMYRDNLHEALCNKVSPGSLTHVTTTEPKQESNTSASYVPWLIVLFVLVALLVCVLMYVYKFDLRKRVGLV